VPPQALRSLRACDGVRWVNLAVDRRPELDETIKLLDMADPTPGFSSFAETAAAIDQLDGVAAIDCSVAHIAAAMGKPVWVLAPSAIDWRWQIGADTKPWWPTATLLRCRAPGDWTHPVAALGAELGRFQRDRRSNV
jgi:ADP-heptose:LPS heptosyltransferase